MVLDSIPMTTAKNVLEKVSDEKLHNLMKIFLKSLERTDLKFPCSASCVIIINSLVSESFVIP